MATPTSLLRHVVFPRAYLLHSAPSPPPPFTQPGSSMAFDLAEKTERQLRRAVRTRGDDFLFARGDLRDVS